MPKFIATFYRTVPQHAELEIDAPDADRAQMVAEQTRMRSLDWDTSYDGIEAYEIEVRSDD